MGRCNMCCLHVVLSVFITLHTYVVTCRTPSKAYKRQTYCKSGRKGISHKGIYRVAGNDDWVWDSKHFLQVRKMLGALTLTSGCALHVHFNRYLHLCDLNGFHGRMQFSLWVGNVYVWSHGCLEVSGVSLCNAIKGERSSMELLIATKANLECSII